MQTLEETPLRLAGVIRESIVDGPGIRMVVFAQGCPHHCKGCHNPETHDPTGGYDSTAVSYTHLDVYKRQAWTPCGTSRPSIWS